MNNAVKTAVPFHPVRWAPVGIDPTVGRMFEESGVVDYIACTDIADFTGFIPAQVRPPDYRSRPDNASWYDNTVALAVAGARHPKLGLIYGGVSTIRSGPVELFRRAMTLNDLAEGNSICFAAIGERYNIVPFGHDRRRGLATFEDHLRLYRLLWERDTPFDFEGHVWRYENAFIGTARSHRPQFWAEGAGPKFIEIAAKYADGWVIPVPTSAATPELFAAKVKHVRELVERNGRDPDTFGICVFPVCLIHDDADLLEAALKNPMVRVMAAIYGRLPHDAWGDEGMPTIFPKGWDYSLHWDASKLSDAEFAELVGKVSDEMVRRSFFIGSVKQVGEQIKGYIEAGATMIHPTDMMGSRTYNWGETDEHITPWTPEALEWRIELFRDMKALAR